MNCSRSSFQNTTSRFLRADFSPYGGAQKIRLTNACIGLLTVLSRFRQPLTHHVGHEDKERHMSILGKLFKPKENPLRKRAATLVTAVEINAASMFVPLLDKFPFVQEADVKHWDFILTVAGVFLAASRLSNLRLGDAREESLMETVAKSLAEWDPDGIRRFDDCKCLFESEYDRLTAAGHEPRFIASDAVGKWIVWNVLGRAPETEDECMLVRATGTMVTHAFFDWWKE
jgi:hypothetical protein